MRHRRAPAWRIFVAIAFWWIATGASAADDRAVVPAITGATVSEPRGIPPTPDSGDGEAPNPDDDRGGIAPAVSDVAGPQSGIVLVPISVTATRSALPSADPTASVAEVSGEEIRRSGARAVDDVLRRVPGFSLFRRLGSGAAHPTTQGVSLRGIGASGASRALVLVDGVPVNDPFGGWIYWSRLPSETIERIEVLRGSGASLWGNYAMGGVVGLRTRGSSRDGAGLLVEGGERGGARTEGWAVQNVGDTAVQADGRWMRSGDYPVIDERWRGPIDRPAGSAHGMGGVRVEHRLRPGASVHVSARGFHEDRDNGTPYTRNETSSGFFRSGLEVDTASRGTVSADVFGTVQEFSSTFSAVPEGRASETPAADQFSVPSQSAGGSFVWSTLARERHHVVAGVDALWVDGASKEYGRYVDGGFTRRREGGATQAMGGVFASDVFELTPRLDVTGALRVDYWETYDGFRRENALDSGASLADRSLDGRSETFFSPRLGVAFEALPQLSLRSAAYRGFRAPTINEQVRPFRVRNDVTEANEGLDAEQLTGVEGGYDFDSGRWRSSATLFWNRIDDPVVNVTVGDGGGVVDPCGFVPAGGVCRQRRNLGSSRVLGVEAAAGVDLGRGVSATLAYLWSDGRIHSAADEPALAGNRIPQVPEHQGTIALDWQGGGPWSASVQMRVVGEQYEDDANSRTLDAFVAVDAFVAREIGAGFEVFAAAENLFDETIQNGRSADGVVSIAAPRLVRAGLRYTFER